MHLWMEDVEKTRQVERYMIIKKMRMTNHRRAAFKLDIVPGKGIVLYEA
ncbi:MAG: ATPase domain-containing protein [Desulfurococcaceae archaeon]